MNKTFPQVPDNTNGASAVDKEVREYLRRLYNALTEYSTALSSGTGYSSSSSSSTDHAALSHLSYATAGHTGFEPTITTLPVSKGGTGAGTFATGSYLIGVGTSPITTKTPSQVLSDIAAEPYLGVGTAVKWLNGARQFKSVIDLGVAGLGASYLNVYNAGLSYSRSANTPIVSFNGNFDSGQEYGTYLTGMTATRAGSTVGAAAPLHNLQLETQENTSAVLTEYNGALAIFSRVLLNNTGGVTSHPDVYGHHEIVEVADTNTSQPRDLAPIAGFLQFDGNTTITGAGQTVYAQVTHSGSLPTITGDVVCFEGAGGLLNTQGLATHGLRIRNISTAAGTYGVYVESGDGSDNYAMMLKNWNAGTALFSVDGLGNSTAINMTSTGYADVRDEFYHRKNVSTPDKAGTGWMVWATRDATGSVAKVNLSNIGTIVASLPVSAAGLPTGSLWNNGGVVNVA